MSFLKLFYRIKRFFIKLIIFRLTILLKDNNCDQYTLKHIISGHREPKEIDSSQALTSGFIYHNLRKNFRCLLNTAHANPNE